MAHVLVFHSVLGLRQIEKQFAAQLRAVGHAVTLPDLYASASASDLDEGFAIKARIGWDAICRRAREAAASAPADAVLAGISMGAGVVAELWPTRPLTAKVLLLHGLADVPASARKGTPVQLHISDTDPFFPVPDIVAWQRSAEASSAKVQVFRYPGVGHYFSDPQSPSYDPTGTSQLWERVIQFLD